MLRSNQPLEGKMSSPCNATFRHSVFRIEQHTGVELVSSSNAARMPCKEALNFLDWLHTRAPKGEKYYEKVDLNIYWKDRNISLDSGSVASAKKMFDEKSK